MRWSPQGLLLLFALFVNQPLAAQSVFDEVPSPTWLAVTKDVVYLPVSYTLNLAAHEGGHYLLARVFDEDATFQLRIGKILLPEGLVGWSDDRVPGWYRPLVAVAGTVFNRGLAELANASLETGAVPYHLEPLLAQTYLGGYVDFPSNLTTAFLGDVFGGFRPEETSNDFHNFVLGVSWDQGVVSRLAVYGGLFALAGVDLYFSQQKIGRNWRRL